MPDEGSGLPLLEGTTTTKKKKKLGMLATNLQLRLHCYQHRLGLLVPANGRGGWRFPPGGAKLAHVCR